MVDVVIDVEADSQLAVKLSSDAWELNVRALPSDLLRLRGIREADWDARCSIRVGTAASASVYWASSHLPGYVDVLIGHDDETWDIGITIPLEAVVEIVGQVENHLWRTGGDPSTDAPTPHRPPEGQGEGAVPLW